MRPDRDFPVSFGGNHCYIYFPPVLRSQLPRGAFSHVELCLVMDSDFARMRVIVIKRIHESVVESLEPIHQPYSLLVDRFLHGNTLCNICQVNSQLAWRNYSIRDIF